MKSDDHRHMGCKLSFAACFRLTDKVKNCCAGWPYGRLSAGHVMGTASPYSNATIFCALAPKAFRTVPYQIRSKKKAHHLACGRCAVGALYVITLLVCQLVRSGFFSVAFAFRQSTTSKLFFQSALRNQLLFCRLINCSDLVQAISSIRPLRALRRLSARWCG